MGYCHNLQYKTQKILLAVLLFLFVFFITGAKRINTYIVGGFGFDVSKGQNYLDLGAELAFSESLSAQISIDLGFENSADSYYYGYDYFNYSQTRENRYYQSYQTTAEFTYGLSLYGIIKRPLFMNMNCIGKTGILLNSDLFADSAAGLWVDKYRYSKKIYLGFVIGIGLEIFISKSVCFETGGLFKQIVNNDPQQLSESVTNKAFVVYTDIKFKIR